MTLIEERLRQISDNKHAIDARVNAETIRPTDQETAAVTKISKRVAEAYRDEIAQHGNNDESLRARIRKTIADEAAKEPVDYAVQKRIERIAIANVLGLGAIEPYMQDASVSEIIVQHYDKICIEKDGIIHPVDAAFTDEQQLMVIINRIVQPVGRAINIAYPMVDARLPDGSRVNATIPPASPDGATLTIRKFPDEAMTADDLLKFGSASPAMMTFLADSVKGKVNIIVSGGTSTGKTTLLNVLSSFIPENELIVTIEDSCELRLLQPNVRRLEARNSNTEGMQDVTVQALVRNSLRMRPDRIVVGEVRDGTIVDMMSAMSTGHDGSLSTIHANSPQNLVNSRIPILYSMNNKVSFSEESQAMQIAEAVQLIVHVSHMKDGSRRITHITHVNGLDDNGHVVLCDVFAYDALKAEFCATGYIPQAVLDHAKLHGVTINTSVFANEEYADCTTHKEG